METIEIRRTVPHCGHFDVIVCGGGVAGVAAAVSASRLGKRTLLIEKSMKLGGLATLGLINFFVPMCNGRGKQIIFGMAEEFLRLSIRYGFDTIPKGWENGVEYKGEKTDNPPRYITRYSAEIFALALTELVKNEGVSLLFDSVVTQAMTSSAGGATHVDGIVVENKSGAQYYTAQMIIDATGDGDVMFRAGMPTVQRGNFDTYIGFQVTLESCRRAAESGNIAEAVTGISGGGASLYGKGHPENMPLYTGTSSDDVNRYLITNQLHMLDNIRASDRGSRNIVTLPGMAQYRTTRRIKGDYTLLESDIYRHFDDSVGAICDFDRRDFLFEIPYRALVMSCWDNQINEGKSDERDK